MVSNKDLMDANAFNTRRLVMAFVSGAPAGRAVQPARTGRTVVAGLTAAALLVIGTAVAGDLSAGIDEDWASRPGLIISRDSGAAYVITEVERGEEPVLRPVFNLTSARLILGAGIEPTIVPEEHLAEKPRGDDIGIRGAPATVPDPALLIDDGWTVCSHPDGGLQVTVTRHELVDPVQLGGVVVRVADDDSDDVYVVAEAADGSQEPWAHSYRLPSLPGRDNLLSSLNLPEAGSAVEVPAQWLALFPEGGDLDRSTFELVGEGQPAGYVRGEAGLESARVGDVIVTPTDRLLLTADGPTALTPFALAVYTHAGSAPTRPLLLGAPPTLTRTPEPYLDASWPSEVRQEVVGEQCALLDTGPGSAPRVHLVQSPHEGASAAAVPRERTSRTVDDGAGAYVLSGSWDATGAGGAPHLIDSQGRRYPLAGSHTAERLGYAQHPVAVVPNAWVELFRPGVVLSEEAARCPPADRGDEPCA